MSSGGEGDQHLDVGVTPDRKPAAVQSSSIIQPSGPDTGAVQDQLSSLSLAEKPIAKSPLTPSTLETKPTGSSVDSAEQDRDETNTPQTGSPRQTIAVGVSKGPSAFFNLARKFLVTDETCDLSALEGAIVSAIDAAHLLERSKIATIIRYVVTSFIACCLYASFDLSIGVFSPSPPPHLLPLSLFIEQTTNIVCRCRAQKEERAVR